MKKHLQTLIFTVALGVIFGSATASFGQMKVGGYKSVAVTDATAVAAAEFAVKTQSEKEEMTIVGRISQKSRTPGCLGIKL